MLPVIHVLGSMLMMFSITYLLPIVTSVIYRDGQLLDFMAAATASLVTGAAIWAATRSHKRELRSRDGFLLVSLAWVLMSGVNSGAEEARELARLFCGVPVRLSVIDVNDPSGRFHPADARERGGFLTALADHGIGFVRRYSGGPDIHAACGMLASLARGGQALAPS